MTINTQPVFTKVSRIGAVSISTANDKLDGTGTIGTAFTAGSNGSRIHRIIVKAKVTTTAGMVRLFIHDGTSYFLYRELVVAAVTAAASTPAFELILELFGERALLLPAGYSLRASTEKAEAFNIIVEGADY